MIDASRSPRSLWRRMLTLLVVVALAAGAIWIIWVKELHHPDVHVPAYLHRGAAPVPASATVPATRRG